MSQEFSLTEIREGLDKKNITITAVATALYLDKGTVSRILKDTYTGKEETKNKVLTHCIDLIQEKPVDLSTDILKKSSLYEKLMKEGSLLNCFTPEEREHFIQMYKALKKYNKRKKTSKRKQIN